MLLLKVTIGMLIYLAEPYPTNHYITNVKTLMLCIVKTLDKGNFTEHVRIIFITQLLCVSWYIMRYKNIISFTKGIVI